MLKSDIVGVIIEIFEFVKEIVKEVVVIVIEVKDCVEVSNEMIGFFGLLCMLKDF